MHKESSFEWIKVVQSAFKKFKSKLYESLVLPLPNFDKAFEVVCDISGVGMKVIFI